MPNGGGLDTVPDAAQRMLSPHTGTPMKPLSKDEIISYHKQLQVLKLELEGLMQATEAGAQPVDLDQPIGRLSRIDAIQAQKLTQANRARSKVRLQHVMAALAAVRDDEYGMCRRCDEEIARERLNAAPESPLCLTCMEAIERGPR